MKKLLNLQAKTKIEIKFYARKILGYLLFLIFVFSFGWLFDKVLETGLMVIGYIATRFLVPKIKHFNTIQKCISISTLTFVFFLSIVCLPKEITFIWNILVGACIPLVMYAESLLFDVKISDEEVLVNLCKAYKYSELKTEIAVRFFVKNQKPKEVWLWLCKTQKDPIEWDSVKQMKWRMKKELFK